MPLPLIPAAVGAAAIGAGGGLLSQWLGSRQQNRNINKTNQANIDLANLRYKNDMKMAEYAYDKNLEMWNMQNQYNSPQAQMQRFEDAGLSKHMIYGQGTPGNATASPTYTPPSYQPPTMDYRGIQSPVGNVLGSVIGASKDMVELANAKEVLDQNAVETWLAENTKYARQGQAENVYQKSFWDAESARIISKINRIKQSFWEKGISPTDSTWLRIAIQVANTFPVGNKLKGVIDSLDPKILKAIQ